MEYLITDIKDLTSKKKLVYINYEPAFALYSGEVFRYNLKAESYISEQTYDEIITTLSKRALTRALYLFKDKDYTEYEIKSKLLKAYYPEQSIEYSTKYLKDNHFINDRRYAYNYITFKSGSYSSKVIVNKLMQKGIASDDIDAAFEEFTSDNSESEYNTLINLIYKKLKSKSVIDLSYEEKQKLIAYMCRKGFSYDMARKAFNEFLDNERNKV